MEFLAAKIKKPSNKPRPYGYPQGVSQTSFGFSVCCDGKYKITYTLRNYQKKVVNNSLIDFYVDKN
ncbi:hypothetical protein ES705_50116 [subsurface metagenome]